MSDNQTSNFPKMGEYPLEDGDFVNVSGQRSRNTIPRGKYAPSGDELDGPTAHRGVGKLATGESNGPKFAPQTTICYTNDPVAHATGRGMRQVSSNPTGGFWEARNNYDDGEVLN